MVGVHAGALKEARSADGCLLAGHRLHDVVVVVAAAAAAAAAVQLVTGIKKTGFLRVGTVS